MNTIDELMDDMRTYGGRDRIHKEYRAGCRAALQMWIEHQRVACPYEGGSVQAKAWYAGYADGRQRAKYAPREEEDWKSEGLSI